MPPSTHATSLASLTQEHQCLAASPVQHPVTSVACTARMTRRSLPRRNRRVSIRHMITASPLSLTSEDTYMSVCSYLCVMECVCVCECAVSMYLCMQQREQCVPRQASGYVLGSARELYVPRV
jgi:hypothetical protein